ncbi:MAG TPA: hypothetical protein VFH68_26215 [Polyangia bacterium]|nr:hypothetical protein [Polyangia bacterium]
MLLATAAACVPWLRDRHSDLVGTAVWALVLLVSWVGWGSLIASVLLPGRRLDWGLDSALGMAGMLALGGVLQIGFLVRPAAVVILTLGGLVALAVTRFRRRAWLLDEARQDLARARAAPIFTAAIVAIYGLAILALLGHLTTPVSNVWDDYEAYFVYPRSILGLGALHEPFSFRRLGALGGQSYLQAFLLTGSTVWRLNGFDNGICFLAILGMVHGYTRGRRALVLIGLAFLVGFTYRLHNIASALSGTVFFFAIFRVLDARPTAGLVDRKVQVVLGLLGAAAWTLRGNYLVAVLATLGAAFGLGLLSEPRQRRDVVRGGLRTLGFLALFLIPWWIVCYRSSGTFLFPIALGNARADFGMQTDVTRAEELHFFLFNAFWNHPVRAIYLFVLGALCLDDARRNRSLHALLLGSGAAVIALIHGCRSWDDVSSVSRYYMSFELALVLAVLVRTLTQLDGDAQMDVRPARARTFLAAALATLAVGIQLWDSQDDIAARYHAWVDQIQAHIARPAAAHGDPADDLYGRIQASVPVGAPFMEILDEPFRFDFRRNRILICDQPGGASPKPGFPIFEGVEAYERYFRQWSIRYLAYTLGPQSPEYNPPPWQAHARNHTPPRRNGHSRGTMLRKMGVIYGDFFQVLDELARRHRHLFDEGQVHVLDLEQPAAAAPAGR